MQRLNERKCKNARANIRVRITGIIIAIPIEETIIRTIVPIPTDNDKKPIPTQCTQNPYISVTGG